MAFRPALTSIGLVLLAFGGYLAGVPAVSALMPASPIMIGVAISALMLLVAMARKVDTRPIVVLLLLAVSFLPGFIYAEDIAPYVGEKTFQLVTLVPLVVVAGAVCVQDREALKWLLGGVVVLGLLVGALSFAFTNQSYVETGRLVAEGSTTIGAGRAAGAACIVAVLAAANTRHKIGWATIAIVAAVTAVFSGSRGPIVAAIAGLAVAFLFSRSRRSVAYTAIVALAGWAGYRVLLANELLPERLLGLEDSSADARLLLAEVTAEHIIENPIGTGWGSLMTTFAQEPAVSFSNHVYPHNIFIELAGEAGWLAAVMLIAVLLIAIYRTSREGQDWFESVSLALLVFFTVNASVSGDLISNRGFWLMLGVCLAARARHRQFCGSTEEQDLQPATKDGGLRAAAG